VTAYLEDGTLPAKNTLCQQEKDPFPPPSASTQSLHRQLRSIVVMRRHG
jgi:hypothetical protein